MHCMAAGSEGQACACLPQLPLCDTWPAYTNHIMTQLLPGSGRGCAPCCRQAVTATHKQSLLQQARAHKALGVVLGAAAAQPGLPQAERAASQDEGLLHLRQALEVDPQDADVLYNLGLLEVGTSLLLGRCSLHGRCMAHPARVPSAHSLRHHASSKCILRGRQGDAHCSAA